MNVIKVSERARHFYERAGWSVEGSERTADVLASASPSFVTNAR